MNKVEIYYFSGTGNSLYVAKELQEGIPGTTIIPILSILDNKLIKTDAETIGFVFPIYFGTIPSAVRKCIKKLNMDSAKYIFAIATYSNYAGLVKMRMDRLIKAKGRNLDQFFELAMTINSPTGIMPKFIPGYQKNVNEWVHHISKENVINVELESQKRISQIQQAIIDKEKNQESISFKFYLKRFVSKLMDAVENSNAKIPYYSDETCSGCGICEKVCLSKKIKLVNEKPVWQKDTKCYYCYACFNFCPTQSILIKDKYNLKSGRYYHPQISADDIEGQKNHL